MMLCQFQIVHETNEFVFIVDLDGKRSVTNDAEKVVQYFHKIIPQKRIMYRDTQGRWDELLHDKHGNFLGFAPGFNYTTLNQ